MSALPVVEQVQLRAVLAGDQSFLTALDASARGDDLRSAGLPEGLIAMQEVARTRAYADAWGAGAHRLVLRNNEPVGAVWVGESADAITLVDLVVEPRCQSQGIGQAVIQHLARLAGERPVRLSVRDDNERALRLYRRLGFQVVGRSPGYLALELRAERLGLRETGS